MVAGALQAELAERGRVGRVGGVALAQAEQLAPELALQRLPQISGIHPHPWSGSGPRSTR